MPEIQCDENEENEIKNFNYQVNKEMELYN